MKTECSIVRDLLPLYAEDMVSDETAEYIANHLSECDECRAELDGLKESDDLAVAVTADTAEAKPFKRIMKRINRQFYTLSYFLMVFFIILGFVWTGGENLMYNSLTMPLVGLFGYYVFRLHAVYKVPILLIIIDIFVCIFGLVELDFRSVLLWTLIYSLFVLTGIAIAFLLHFAFRKENK